MNRGTAEGAKCIECPLSSDGCPNKPVFGIGPGDPKWIALGEGPGNQEVVFGTPFVGPSGKLVMKALAATRRSRSEIWITNATLCRPQVFHTDEDKEAARKACRPRLIKELQKLPTVPILALGAVAARTILGKRVSIHKIAGSCHEIDTKSLGKRHMIGTLHPASILRGGAGSGAHSPDLAFWNLVYDTAKVDKISQGVDIFLDEEAIDIECEDTARADELVSSIVEEIKEIGQFACDTETYVKDRKRYSAKQPLNALMSAIGIATYKRAVAIAWDILSEEAKACLNNLFSSTEIQKVFHNSIYDIPVLKRHGFTVSDPVIDTLLQHHAAFPGLAHNLQRVATQFFAISPWKAEFRSGSDSIVNLLRYNAKDTLSTAKIVAPLQVCIKKTQSELAYEMDVESAKTARLMHEKGIPISREVNQYLYDRFLTNMKGAWESIKESVYDTEIREDLWQRLAHEQAKTLRKRDSEDYDIRAEARYQELRDAFSKGKWAFKIGSGAHVSSYLRARGVPLYTLTNKGFISTRKEILEQYAHKSEVRAILDYRTNQKLFSTYVYRMFDRYNEKGKIIKYGYSDGNSRIHPHWSVHKITGRWGASDPPAQNWPGKDPKTDRPSLKTQVVAREDMGRVLVGFDFGQLEARIIALLSGDPFLVDIFARDKDIHIEFARIVFPKFDTQPEDVRKKLRDDIKRPEYGALYGAKAETLWTNLRKDYPTMQLIDVVKMLDIMTSNMVGVTKWHNDLIRQTAKPPHEIRSLITGRRRVFPLGNASVNDLYNFPVQSTAGDIMNSGLIRFMKRLKKYRDAFPIIQVHDALVTECYEEDAEAIEQDVSDCFEQEYTHNGVTIKFPVKPKTSRTWADV